MKHKLKTFILILGLIFGFIPNVYADTTIKEDASTYEGDIYIIGSSKFDSNIIVTGTMASVAGAREAYIQYVVNQNYKFKPEDVKIYYYSELAETWSLLPATSGEEMKELTEEETEELTENLNIYYVNEEEKMLEVPYDIILEDGYELKFKTDNEDHIDIVKYEDGKLTLPATAVWVEVYATKEPEVEGEEPEEIYLGDVIQNEGEFTDAFRLVRTYEELKLAIDSGIEDVQIEANIDLPTALTINKKLNIYLNKANITVKEDPNGDGVFLVVEGGHLTINGEGTIDGVGKNNYSMAIWANGGEVVINGGHFTNVGAGEDDHYDLIYVKNGGKATINGGTFECQTPKWTLNLKDRDTSSIAVKGGTFKAYNPAAAYTEPTQPLNFVAEGYKVTEKDGYYTVVELDETETLLADGMAYETLAEAVENSDEQVTIKLMKDIELPTAQRVTKKLILELNEKTISVPEDPNGDGVFLVVKGGHLTINGEGTINGVGKNDYSMAIWANGGEVVINGGHFTNIGAGEDDHYDLIYVKNGGKATINGGTFECQTPKWTLNLKDRDTSSIIVKGGTFKGYNPAETYTEPTQPLDLVAEGYLVTEKDGTYTVTKNTSN